MKKVLISLFLVLILSNNVFAGFAKPYDKADIKFIPSQKNPGQISVTVNVPEKYNGGKIAEIRIDVEGTNNGVKCEIKDGKAILTFELEKTKIEKAKLYFNYPNEYM